MDVRSQASWKGDRLYVSGRLSGYGILADEVYPMMWRVRRPDGSVTEMVNRVRAKDAALGMLDRDLRRGESPPGGRGASFAA